MFEFIDPPNWSYYRNPIEILIDLEYCKACGLCALFCPRGAITMVEETG